MKETEVYNSPTGGDETVWRIQKPLVPGENRISLEGWNLDGHYAYTHDGEDRGV